MSTTTDYSIKDISELSGVSISTISRYFNGQSIRKSNQDKIEEILHQTGYQPNIAARFMKGQNTDIIGLILPELTHPYFACIADGIMSAASNYGLSVLCGSSEGSSEKEKKIIDQFSRSILDGLIYIPVSQAEDIPSIDSFRDLPLVISARRNIIPGVPHVYHDGVKGGYLAAKYLMQLGRKRIAFVASFWNPPVKNGEELLKYVDTPASYSFSSCERLKGYLKALDEAGLPIDPELILVTGYGYDNGMKVGSSILKTLKSVDGIILMDQSIANGCAKQLDMQGINVPDDVSMIIYDSEDCATDHKFTTVNLQLKEMGRITLEKLVSLMRGNPEEDTRLDVDLQLRDTTSRKSATE